MIKLLLVSLFSVFAFANGGGEAVANPDITMTWVGIGALIIFVIAYYFVATEEKYHIDKAKPALFAGTLLFMLIASYYAINGMDMTLVHNEVEHLILEIAEIFFFFKVVAAKSS